MRFCFEWTNHAPLQPNLSTNPGASCVFSEALAQSHSQLSSTLSVFSTFLPTIVWLSSQKQSSYQLIDTPQPRRHNHSSTPWIHRDKLLYFSCYTVASPRKKSIFSISTQTRVPPLLYLNHKSLILVRHFYCPLSDDN